MINLTLKEVLLTMFQENGKSIDDVDFVLVRTLGLNLDGFWKSAADCIWDINKLNDEFRVVFKDKTWIEKVYDKDGNAKLKYRKLFEKPVCVLVYAKPREFYDVD